MDGIVVCCEVTALAPASFWTGDGIGEAPRLVPAMCTMLLPVLRDGQRGCTERRKGPWRKVHAVPRSWQCAHLSALSLSRHLVLRFRQASHGRKLRLWRFGALS